ncbi:MAG TPA: hypothetical protein VII38_23610 [Polyangia bacterium]
MRASVLFGLILVGCGPAVGSSVRKPSPVPGAAAAGERPIATPAAPPGCKVALRTVSLPGRGGARPSLAQASGAYAVVWEETAEDHRGVHFQALDGEARPLGPSVEVADLERGGAEPKVVADGDGFAIVWTIDEPDTSLIAFRRVDAHGRPRGDVITAVSSPHARALALAKVEGGFALGWWSWSGTPPSENLTWLDADGRPHGRAVRVSTGLLVDPEMDLRAVEGAGDKHNPEVRAAWIEAVNGDDHVLDGVISRTAVSGKVDLGPGDRPALVSGGVLFANPTDASVWLAPVDGAQPPERVTDGQMPAAADSRLCLYRTVTEQQRANDELHCMGLDGARPVDPVRVAVAPGGVLTLALAAPESSSGFGVVFQTEAGDTMKVVFAAVECANKK